MVEIYLNNEWINITNQLLNQVSFDGRIDEVFDTGTFAFQSKVIDYNIAPLTPCRIDDEYWLCSSTANKIIPGNYWNHDVQLLETTYITHTVIIGSKAFSNRGKYKTHNAKLKAIVELANAKNYALFGAEGDEYSIEYFPESKNIEREFTFGAGTSLFQMLLEIGKTVDAIPRITKVTQMTNYNKYHISWDYIDSNNLYELDESKILGIQYSQDAENYTEVLEAEMTNVVDRDTIVTVKNLTVRSEDAVINSDNQVLILPSNAEEIVGFEINGQFPFEMTIRNISIDYYPSSSTSSTYRFLWSVGKNNAKFSLVAKAIEEALKFYKIPIDNNWVFEARPNSTTFEIFVDPVNLNDVSLFNFSLDITSNIVESKLFGLLEVDKQPNYFTYTSGSNKIENLFSFYKNDVWNTILGNNAISAIPSAIKNKNIYVDFEYGTIQTSFYESYSDNPIEYLFNVSYKPVVDTFIVSDNVKIPFNEDKIKHTSRSFEASASITDFNLLVPSINKSNAMLGMPEVTISYAGINYPRPSNLIIVKGQNYYVSSVQTTITNGHYVSYINLVSSYSKIAEVFGVASQYESTKLPLNNIITRFVYCGEWNNTSSYVPTGIRLQSSAGTYYKRGVIIQHDNSKYLIVSADDNYSFTSGMVENEKLDIDFWSEKGGIFENKEYAYADSDNEEETYLVELIKEDDDLTLEESRDLPNLPYSRYTLLSVIPLTTYKDARERLIFVIKLI